MQYKNTSVVKNREKLSETAIQAGMIISAAVTIISLITGIILAI